jgi:hypothetical protein
MRAWIRAPFDARLSLLKDNKIITLKVEILVGWQAA